MSGNLKDRLRRGEVVYGQMILELFTPGTGQMLANSGLEFIIFDMEHGRFDIGLAAGMIASCRGAGIVPMVRVPDLNACPLSRLLDLGARGVALGLAHDDYNPKGAAHLESANQQTIVIALVDTVRAFENLDEIVATPGPDIAWMGHFDLTVSMGIPAQFNHPRFLEAMDRLASWRKPERQLAAVGPNDTGPAVPAQADQRTQGLPHGTVEGARWSKRTAPAGGNFQEGG